MKATTTTMQRTELIQRASAHGRGHVLEIDIGFNLTGWQRLPVDSTREQEETLPEGSAICCALRGIGA